MEEREVHTVVDGRGRGRAYQRLGGAGRVCIRSNPIPPQIDPKSGVQIDQIAEYPVVCWWNGSGHFLYVHAIATVGIDIIPVARVSAANKVSIRIDDTDAVTPVVVDPVRLNYVVVALNADSGASETTDFQIPNRASIRCVAKLSRELSEQFKSIPVVAEDLGIITQDVKDAMARFGFPGMKLLIFAFDGDILQNPYAPANHVKNCILYTGTHDCNTTRGWFDEEMSDESKLKLESIIGHKVNSATVAEEMVVLAMRSIANTVILPMQDVLGLGSNARMNCPGTAENNWEWRLRQWSNDDVAKLAELTKTYGRG